MGTARALHTATLLPSGQLFVAGGVDASGHALDLTALVTPTAVTAGPRLTAARYGHTATLLANGQVLLAGGQGTAVLGTTEIYDPVAGAITPGPSLGVARTEAAAVAYGAATAQHVLIVGGSNGTAALGSAEDFDATAGTFTAVAAPMNEARSSAGAALLDNGTILIASGDGVAGPAGAEIFDPTTGAFTATTMTVARTGGAFVADGAQAMVAGGHSTTGDEKSTEIFDDTTKLFTQGVALSAPRRDATASRVPSKNEIVVIGGRSGTAASGTVEVFTGTTLATAKLTSAMPLANARYGHTANADAAGKVLVVGGFSASGVPLATVEYVNPTNTTTPRVGSTKPTTTTTTPATTTTTPSTTPSPTPSNTPAPVTTPATTGSTGSGGILQTILSALSSLLGGSGGSSGGIGSILSSLLGSLTGGSSGGSGGIGSILSSLLGSLTGGSSGGGIGSLLSSLLGGSSSSSGSGGIGSILSSLLGSLTGGGSSSSSGGIGGILSSLLGGLFGGSSSTTPPASTTFAVGAFTPGSGHAGSTVSVTATNWTGPNYGIALDAGNGAALIQGGSPSATASGTTLTVTFTIPAGTATGNYSIAVADFDGSSPPKQVGFAESATQFTVN